MGISPDETSFWSFYDYVLNQIQDPKTEEWFLVKNPLPVSIIIILYVVFCAFSKKIVAGLPKYELTYVLKLYNFSMVLLSIYMTYEFFMSSYLAGYSLICQPVDYSENELSRRMASASWWYFISKILEIFDTVFFVLRKKFNQVSFLHVYHHTTVIFFGWIGAKSITGGQAFFVSMLNSFVHVIMYSYYFLSSFGPHMQKYLWWKKYVTKIQLTQFFAIIVHSVVNQSVECSFPRLYNYVSFYLMSSYIVLFFNFYFQSYLKKKKPLANKKLQ